MSDEKSKVSDKAGEIARNIWLAGVGAYGKAVEDAQGRIEKAMEPPKLFRDLVKAGTALEEDARAAIESTSAARQSVEERINRVRENFQMQRPARLEEVVELRKQVEKLTRKVDRLSRELAAARAPVVKKSAKTSAKKKPAKAKAPAKKAKTTTRKSPAKKPAASRAKSTTRKRKS
jgi:polyhydroxyalkanoate synthesis regulator phasin